MPRSPFQQPDTQQVKDMSMNTNLGRNIGAIASSSSGTGTALHVWISQTFHMAVRTVLICFVHSFIHSFFSQQIYPRSLQDARHQESQCEHHELSTHSQNTSAVAKETAVNKSCILSQFWHLILRTVTSNICFLPRMSPTFASIKPPLQTHIRILSKFSVKPKQPRLPRPQKR